MKMTNKEAIKLIQSIEEDGWNVFTEHLEALDLAIKALKMADCPQIQDECHACGGFCVDKEETT